MEIVGAARTRYGQRIAIGLAVGLSLEAVVVGLGQLHIAGEPSAYRCAPPGLGDDPLAYGLGCMEPTFNRWAVVLAVYAVALAAMVVALEVSTRPSGRASGVLTASGGAFMAAVPFLFAGPLVSGAPPTARWAWVALTLAIPALAAGSCYLGLPEREVAVDERSYEVPPLGVRIGRACRSMLDGLVGPPSAEDLHDPPALRRGLFTTDPTEDDPS